MYIFIVENKDTINIRIFLIEIIIKTKQFFNTYNKKLKTHKFKFNNNGIFSN